MGRAGEVLPLTAAEVAAAAAPRSSAAGCGSPAAATVQPARLAFGLRDRVRAAGASIHEGSRVRRFVGGPAPRVLTDSGEVRAGAVVLAVNHASAGLGAAAPGAGGRVQPPRPDRARAGRPRARGLDGRRVADRPPDMLHYFRTTPDGRIAFGWGGGPHGAGRSPAPGARRRPRRRGPDAPRPRASLPRPGRPARHPRLGRPHRRLPDAAAAGPTAAAAAPATPPGSRATGSARPTWSAASSPRWPSTGATRHASPSSTPRPALPPGAVPLGRRRGNPPRHPQEGGSRDGRPPPRPIASAVAEGPGADRLPHRHADSWNSMVKTLPNALLLSIDTYAVGYTLHEESCNECVMPGQIDISRAELAADT